jgi:hypothetical protein
VAVEDRWDLVNYIYSLGDGDDPGYATLLRAAFVEDELELESADELFEGAIKARFPLLGQIIEPGRNFYPSVTSIEVKAVYNRSDIVFQLRWHDMRAETAGKNAPDEPVPLWDEDQPAASADAGDGEEGGDFWGGAAVEEEEDDDFWGDAAVGEDEGDFWGEEDEGDASIGGEFSDAVALQFPTQLPSGIRKPYFLFGDGEKSVDLWFVDLARGAVEQFVGRGSDSLTPTAIDEFELLQDYEEGEWTIVFRRSLRSTGNLSFAAGQYAPIAFSVWDGFNEERGNKRALSSWFHLYVTPAEEVSATGPMARAALGTLAVEILIIFFLRRRFQNRAIANGAGA